MQKGTSKLQIVIFIIMMLVAGYFVFFREKAEAPVVEEPVIDMTMPPVSNKDQIEGRREDLISFSITPGSTVYNIVSYRGTVQGAYFFEGNILVSVLDANKNVIRGGHAMATTDWMTGGPVDFEGNIDFRGLPNGPAYILIQNDDPSDGEGGPPKKIFIPIVIDNPVVANYTYHNHGITFELPKGYIPHEEQSEGGPSISIDLPNSSHLNYVTNFSWWQEHVIPEYTYLRDEKFGSTNFKVYEYSGTTIYLFKQGNVGYEFYGDVVKIMQSFRFVGWSQ